VDIWSLGCIIAELAYVWNSADNNKSDKILFRGSNCFPLSPVKEGVVGSNDQLIKILETLGPQEDFGGKLGASEKNYVSKVSKMVKRNTPLKDKFKDLHPEIFQMIEGMLAFDPDNRITLD
jgi:serine/threonine protein kinase